MRRLLDASCSPDGRELLLLALALLNRCSIAALDVERRKRTVVPGKAGTSSRAFSVCRAESR